MDACAAVHNRCTCLYIFEAFALYSLNYYELCINILYSKWRLFMFAEDYAVVFFMEQREVFISR